MKIKKIAIFLLLITSFCLVNVNAVENTYNYNIQTEDTETDDNDYLPPVDTTGYEIHDDHILTDGGTFHPITILSFRIAVISIVCIILWVSYKKKKNNRNEIREEHFYQE